MNYSPDSVANLALVYMQLALPNYSQVEQLGNVNRRRDFASSLKHLPLLTLNKLPVVKKTGFEKGFLLPTSPSLVCFAH